jgi:polysaccharide pyruvyl transferase WcaK-like protein
MKFRWTPLPLGRVAFLTPYDGGNLGDAAIHEALIANFRRFDPSIRLCGITLDPDRTSRLHGIPCYSLAVTSRPHYHPKREQSQTHEGEQRSDLAPLSIGRFQRFRRVAAAIPFLRRLKILADEAKHVVRSYRLLRDIDMLVVAGGGQLDEEWGGPCGHPYALMKWTVLARAAGSSVVFLSTGACQMKSKLTRLFLKRALSLASYRSYRDEESRRLACLLTRKGEGAVIPDLAFSLPLQGPQAEVEANQTGVRVGVSPIAYGRSGLWPSEDPVQHERYMSQLAGFVASLLRRGMLVTLFSSSCPDERLFVDLQARINPGLEDEARQRLSTTDVTSLDDLLTVLRSFDFVVSSRLHGVLLSFVTGKPAVAISYDRKVRCLMDEMGQSFYCLDIESFTSDDLLTVFLDLQVNRAQVAEKLKSTRCSYNEMLESQYLRVTRLLANHNDPSLRTDIPVARD